jgi:hypothetical protein
VTRLKLHWQSLVIGIAGIATLASSRNDATWYGPLALALGVALIACAAYTAGVRDTLARLHESIDWMPKTIHLHDDDAGHTHALVETLGGDVLSIDIPDACTTRDETMQYVLHVLASEDDDE